MPQLSPMNWLMLFVIFWIVLILLMSVLWWGYDKKFFINLSNNENFGRLFCWM